MYHVDITHRQGFEFGVKSADSELTIDITGKGITPPDTLLASLGSCIGVYIRKYAEGARLPLEGFVIKVQAELCVESPKRFKLITVGIDLKGADLDERRRHSLLEFVRNCPVHHTLEACPSVDIQLT